MKVLHVDERVGLGEMVWGKRWINGMSGMTILGLLRTYGWWWRVPTIGQAQELLQYQNILQFLLLLWRSNLWEVNIFNHVIWGVFSWKDCFSRNYVFFCRIVFMAHFQVAMLSYLPSWAGTDSLSQNFYHRFFFTGFLSQDFYHKVFSTLVISRAEIVIKEADFTSPSCPKAEVERC